MGGSPLAGKSHVPCLRQYSLEKLRTWGLDPEPWPAVLNPNRNLSILGAGYFQRLGTFHIRVYFFAKMRGLDS